VIRPDQRPYAYLAAERLEEVMSRFLQYIGSWFGFGANGAPAGEDLADTPTTPGRILEIEASCGPERTLIPETIREATTADPAAQNNRGSDLWAAFLRQGPDEFRDAVAFCSVTVLVEPLQKLISRAELRLTGKGGDPVVVLESESCFGKTHSMLALYHIFSGVPVSRLPGMEGVVGHTKAPHPLKVHRVVLVGDQISPANLHHKPDGTLVRTLWGELAWQLGGRDGYEIVRESDERATNPGGSLVFLLQRYSPCLILADEWPAHILRLQQNSSLPAGPFGEHLSFAKALAHAVRYTTSNLLVVALPARAGASLDPSQQPLIDQLRQALDTLVSAPSAMDDRQLLDDLFRATVTHRSSQVYRDLLEYVSRFRRYSAYNCFLIRLQRPTVGYVATPSDWMKEFERRVKSDARPLVMLRPFGPVMFVYDIGDTEGEQPPPADLLKPFDAKGVLDPLIWSNTETNCARDHIRIVPRDMQLNSAGWARCTRAPGTKQVPEFEVTYNKNQKPSEAYCTLAHELAHIYLGHVCGHPRRKWPDRRKESKDVREFEAESVAYIVCARQGIMTTAPQYLADYLGHNDEIPPIDIHRVLVIASKIEEIGRTLKRPKKDSGTREEEDDS
jgi:hypothetical protein